MPKPHNKKNTYFIRIKKTGEILDSYRTKGVAIIDVPRWKNLIRQEVEIISKKDLLEEDSIKEEFKENLS